jgi:hypothetical protein
MTPKAARSFRHLSPPIAPKRGYSTAYLTDKMARPDDDLASIVAGRLTYRYRIGA